MACYFDRNTFRQHLGKRITAHNQVLQSKCKQTAKKKNEKVSSKPKEERKQGTRPMPTCVAGAGGCFHKFCCLVSRSLFYHAVGRCQIHSGCIELLQRSDVLFQWTVAVLQAEKYNFVYFFHLCWLARATKQPAQQAVLRFSIVKNWLFDRHCAPPPCCKAGKKKTF